MKYIKNVGVLVGVLLGLIVTFSLLMIAQAVLPDSLVECNVVKSFEMLERESGNISNGISLSGYTETIMLKNSITSNNQFHSSPENFNDFQEAFWNHGLETRYWQGYLIFLKPLLIFFDIAMIRNIVWIVFIGLLCALLFLLAKKSRLLSVALLVSVGLISPYLMISALSFVPVFIIMLLASMALIRLIEKGKDSLFRVVLLFLIVGGCTAFFDFLTTPIITLGIPLLIYLAYKYWEREAVIKPVALKPVALTVCFTCLCWGMGYVIVWVSDWVLATFVTGHDVVGDALRQLVYRSGESTVASEAGGVSFSRLDAVLANIGYFPYLIALSIMSVVCACVVIAAAQKKLPVIILFLSMATVSITPLLWMLVTANHVFVHAHFTHRGMVVYLFGCFLPIVLALSKAKGGLLKRPAEDNAL